MVVKEQTKTIDKLIRDIHKNLVNFTKSSLKENDLTMLRFLGKALTKLNEDEQKNLSRLLTIILDDLETLQKEGVSQDEQKR